MRIDPLPAWAAMALLNGPVFGSEGEGGEGAPAGAATVENPPEENPADADKEPVNEEAAKAIRERDALKAERDALAQEKQEREEAEAQAKAATRSKEENLENENTTLREDNEALIKVNEQNLLKLAIYENTKYQWIDINDVTLLLDRTGIKINAKTGKVEGAEDALKSLAKAKPHLLKPSEDNQGNSGNGNGAPPSGPAVSGGTPGGNRDASAAANKRKALVERFGTVLGA